MTYPSSEWILSKQSIPLILETSLLLPLVSNKYGLPLSICLFPVAASWNVMLAVELDGQRNSVSVIYYLGLLSTFFQLSTFYLGLGRPGFMRLFFWSLMGWKKWAPSISWGMCYWPLIICCGISSFEWSKESNTDSCFSSQPSALHVEQGLSWAHFL